MEEGGRERRGRCEYYSMGVSSRGNDTREEPSEARSYLGTCWRERARRMLQVAMSIRHEKQLVGHS